MFQINSVVNYSELDVDGRMALGALIDQFQNCTTLHSESVGLGMKYLKQRQRVWILSGWQICVDRYPGLGEAIKVFTWPTAFKGLYGLRNFKMEDESGEILAWANSVWVFMDLKAGRPVRPDSEEIENYQLEAPLPFEFAPRKVKIPEQREVIETFPVRRYQLDTNRHVNNGQYVRMAAEYIPENRMVKQVRVSYHKSAVSGDEITTEQYSDGSLYTVVLTNRGQEVYAVVEFETAEKQECVC